MVQIFQCLFDSPFMSLWTCGAIRRHTTHWAKRRHEWVCFWRPLLNLKPSEGPFFLPWGKEMFVKIINKRLWEQALSVWEDLLKVQITPTLALSFRIIKVNVIRERAENLGFHKIIWKILQLSSLRNPPCSFILFTFYWLCSSWELHPNKNNLVEFSREIMQKKTPKKYNFCRATVKFHMHRCSFSKSHWETHHISNNCRKPLWKFTY